MSSKFKTKPQTKAQIDFVFNFPITYSSMATVSYPTIPNGFNILDLSTDRGGSCRLEEITVSEYGDPDVRVLGVRVWDKTAGIFKEDIREYDRSNMVTRIYPKGRYQKINPLYKGTHHK